MRLFMVAKEVGQGVVERKQRRTDISLFHGAFGFRQAHGQCREPCRSISSNIQSMSFLWQLVTFLAPSA